jgi:Tfp pilus assembly protein PilF
MKALILVVFLAASSFGESSDPLTKAYEALKARDYDQAIPAFLKAVAGNPQRADIRKDLAYTYLKVGEAEAGRDQFGEAMRLDPADTHVAMEYAFLCYESRNDAIVWKALARRIFDRLRKQGNAEAERAFQNIDRPLAEGIDRWTQALQLGTDNFSAHYELAQLAEQRDQLDLAAEHYLRA